LRSVKQHRARIRAEASVNVADVAEEAGVKDESPNAVNDAVDKSASPSDESSGSVQTPNSLVKLQKDASAFDHFNRMPPELALMQASSLIDSLHGVWITCTKGMSNYAQSQSHANHTIALLT